MNWLEQAAGWFPPPASLALAVEDTEFSYLYIYLHDTFRSAIQFVLKM